MFGYSNQDILEVWPQTCLPPPPILSLIKYPIPIQLGLNRAINKESTNASKRTSSNGMRMEYCNNRNEILE
jgi:hypothetical protein